MTTPIGSYAAIQASREAQRTSAWKPPVRVVATGLITPVGTQTVDTVALKVGDDVLLTANGVDNGPRTVATGAWGRPEWADKTGKLVRGARVAVAEGTRTGETWFLDSATPTIGVSSQTWTLATAGLLLATVAPPAVAAASALGISTRAAKEDHTHEGDGIDDGTAIVTFTSPDATPVTTPLITPTPTGGLNSCGGHARIVAIATRANGTVVTIELLATWRKLSGSLSVSETSQLHPSPDLDATAEVVASGGTSIAIQTTGPAAVLAWDVRIELYQEIIHLHAGVIQWPQNPD